MVNILIVIETVVNIVIYHIAYLVNTPDSNAAWDDSLLASVVFIWIKCELFIIWMMWKTDICIKAGRVGSFLE